ncbi:MAG: ankyrin repeat domain-containing protein [Gemmataceae bacterium]|nr:ankyrin repeat domain-containing protein [Gemmataceae bacterium]
MLVGFLIVLCVGLVFAFILTRGSSVAVHELDREGRSKLHYAAADNDVDLVGQLIRSGQNINLQDNHGFTPLHFAAQQQNVEVARILLNAGAVIDAKNEHGNTALLTAVLSSRGNGELIQLLRKRGADPNATNNHGVSPASLARSIANFDIAQFFQDLSK